MISANDIRQILAGNEELAHLFDQVSEDDDLFHKGLSSFGSVQLMLALEDRFGIEFPDHLLNRRSFSTIRNIRNTLEPMVGQRAA